MGSRGLTAPRLAAAVVAVLLAAGCGTTTEHDTRGKRLLPPGKTVFAEHSLLWAQGGVIHDGKATYDVSPEVVREMTPTRYGLLLRLADSQRDGAKQRTVLFDGQKSTPIPGAVSNVSVSPDGRYAGWIDYDGPESPAGTLAEVVVVDLKTGRTAFTNHDGMGGEKGDDLGDRYEELPPAVLGFDEEFVYWRNASGSGERMRANLASGEVERAETDSDSQPSKPIGQPFDRVLGYQVALRDGRPVWDDTGGDVGFLSPDKRFAFETGTTGKLVVTNAKSGKRITPAYGHRWIFFGGWLGDDTFYALARDKYEWSYDPDAPDKTTGFLISCSLRSGTCRDLKAVTGTRSLVLATDISAEVY